jgi:uncharacterized protein YsxB (DUF464 family)
MISVRFSSKHGLYTGFSVSGHSGYAVEGKDIVCASVSAAVGLAECAISDVIGADATVEIDEKAARVSIKLASPGNECQIIIRSLFLYLSELSSSYPQYITISEV